MSVDSHPHFHILSHASSTDWHIKVIALHSLADYTVSPFKQEKKQSTTNYVDGSTITLLPGLVGV